MNRPLADRRVLVVEDEMIVLMGVEDMLADLGCESVSTAASVPQALALIATQTYDAAILDLNLNGARSYAIADALRVAGVPFAFVTGYGSQGLRESDKTTPLLAKPYSDAELGITLEQLMSNNS